jgi:hypothetical protein
MPRLFQPRHRRSGLAPLIQLDEHSAPISALDRDRIPRWLNRAIDEGESLSVYVEQALEQHLERTQEVAG